MSDRPSLTRDRGIVWTSRRCVVVVACPSCSAECMAILEARLPTVAPIDVDDVRRAHDLLESRDWQIEQLFVA